MIQLVIQFDPNSDACQVQGIPCGQDATGQQKALKGVCYAALKVAEKVIDAFDPNAKDKPAITIASEMPPVPEAIANRIDGRRRL